MTTLAAGSSDDIRVTLCCARIRWADTTGWCRLPDGHDGGCEGALSAPPKADGFGPRTRSKRP